MKRLRYSYLALILGSALPLSAYADGYLSNDNIRQFDARFNFPRKIHYLRLLQKQMGVVKRLRIWW